MLIARKTHFIAARATFLPKYNRLNTKKGSNERKPSHETVFALLPQLFMAIIVFGLQYSKNDIKHEIKQLVFEDLFI